MSTAEQESGQETMLAPTDLEQSDTVLVENEDDDDSSLKLPKSAFTPINFSSGGRRVIDLYRAYKVDKELDPRPSFQRGYVWDKNRATKLIESILLHVPLPLVYTAEEDNGVEVVIDGQQRLTTCFSFIDGYFPLSKKDEERKARGETVKNRPFRLGKMKILSHLEGKSYEEMESDEKKTINNFNIHIIKISKYSHPDVKFEIFERLNTGSASLSDQEIRNCIYRGTYNNFISEIANNATFQTILGIKNSAARMQDVELVLRFMAFNEVSYINYDQKMRGFLNTHMRENRSLSQEKQERYKRDFITAIENTFSVFGEQAFRRYSPGSSKNPNGRWESAVNKALFDIIMFWFARYEKRQIIHARDAIRERFIELSVSDQDFIDAVTLGTADPGRVRTRFKKWGDALEAIIEIPQDERRLFSFEEKRSLFQKDPICAICNQQISHIEDCEIDHIKPYSQGGSTSTENGRLTHRYCNRARGAR